MDDRGRRSVGSRYPRLTEDIDLVLRQKDWKPFIES